MADDMWASVDAGLRKNTGAGLDDWVAKAKASGIDRHKALVDHLKSAEGLTHGYANSVALRTFGTDAGAIGDEALMAAMFAGPKAALRPIHDRLTAFLDTLGTDVEFAPKKGYVSVRRAKQFAILQPSTKDRFDLGLNLKGVAPAGRLEASGSFNAMVSHRVRIGGLDEVDGDVEAWLRDAYERAAK
ncbi:MAG TPA: DUF5655 domain-containing protein [Allosphingosinicella sp.]|nr:DUF5655 domain-containing protein [Allosphingosinicella sp.]